MTYTGPVSPIDTLAEMAARISFAVTQDYRKQSKCRPNPRDMLGAKYLSKLHHDVRTFATQDEAIRQAKIMVHKRRFPAIVSMVMGGYMNTALRRVPDATKNIARVGLDQNGKVVVDLTFYGSALF